MADSVKTAEQAMIEGRYAPTINEWRATLPAYLKNNSFVIGYMIEAWREGYIHFVMKENKDG